MEFIKKNKVIIIIAALIIIFAVSIALTPKEETYLIENATADEFVSAIKEDKPVIVTLAQTTCGHCTNFKPTAKEFAKKYDIDFYWIEVDLLGEEDYYKVTGYFDDFSGTPYTAVLQKGKIVGKVQGGAVSYSSLLEQIESFKVKLKEREK